MGAGALEFCPKKPSPHLVPHLQANPDLGTDHAEAQSTPGGWPLLLEEYSLKASLLFIMHNNRSLERYRLCIPL
jgi:hypothetical protein